MATSSRSIQGVRSAQPSIGATRVARWRPAPAIGAVVAGFAAMQAVGFGLSAALGGRAGAVGASLAAADLILLAVVLWVARRGADHLGGRTLGLRRTALGPALGWAAAVLVLSFAVNGILAVLFGHAGHGHRWSAPHAHALLLVLIAFGVAVAAPIAEEITFRGFLFPALTTWRGPWIGAVLTAALFGAAHAFSLPFPFQIGAAAFGLGACLLYWFTGSVLPGVALHSFNNALVLTLALNSHVWPAIFAAPLLSLGLLVPFARERAQPVS